MKHTTQRERIIEKLRADGEITSVFAVREMFILRLSERIRELEEQGWVFKKSFVEVDGKRTQSYRYEVVSAPEAPKRRVVEIVVAPDGSRRAVESFV